MNQLNIEEAGTSTLFSLIPPILNFLIGLGAFIAVLMVIYAGIMYLTSAGDEKKVAQAKRGIFGSAIGVILVVLSYAILIYIENVIIGGEIASPQISNQKIANLNVNTTPIANIIEEKQGLPTPNAVNGLPAELGTNNLEITPLKEVYELPPAMIENLSRIPVPCEPGHTVQIPQWNFSIDIPSNYDCGLGKISVTLGDGTVIEIILSQEGATGINVGKQGGTNQVPTVPGGSEQVPTVPQVPQLPTIP